MKRKRVSSLIWLSFAIFITFESYRLPLGSFHDPGAGFVPFGVGLILGMLSLCNFYSLPGKVQEPAQSFEPDERLKTLGLVLAVLFGYAFALEFLGFLITTFLSLVVLFRALQPLPWIKAAGGSAIVTLTSYGIFELWLKTQLPKGILGF